MKIAICTTPIRPAPTDYPPFGSLAIIKSLRRDGWDPYFYDIDGLRPSFEEVEAFFTKYQPDVVGISAVVSTAYAYTKKLSRMIKRVAPKSRIVVGGNLAASAEILHRSASVDYCVVGEGETPARELIRYLSQHPNHAADSAELLRIRGITFLDSQGEMQFSGYAAPLQAEDVFDPDYAILEDHSRISNFINDPLLREDFRQDARTHQPHRKGQRMATLITSKGCVGRCTFCHRWDKGYRAIPVPKIIQLVRYLKGRYNVGFFQFSDENFGSDKRQLADFIAAIKQENVLYHVGGVRVRSVSPDILRALRDSGCVAIYYGMETGSPDILEVMEKKASQADNENAARWTHEAGLYTIYQLVLGMPGETETTILATTEFLKRATELLPQPPIQRLSINYIQALPGTPVYEYARNRGLIGCSLQDEERYLLAISDINAADETKFINFTDHDLWTVRSWRRRILLDVTHHYRKIHNLPRPGIWQHPQPDAATSGPADYFNLQRSRNYNLISAYCYPLGAMILWLWLAMQEFRRLSLQMFLARLGDNILARIRPAPPPFAYKSLRRIMQDCTPRSRTASETAMAILRAGR